jgi:hypothetical protein
MLHGVIVAESLRLGAVIEDVQLLVHKRVDPGVDEQPPHWTLMSFEAAEADADRLADALSDALEPTGGWYADFHSDTDVTVVSSGHIFRYRRGDKNERAKVEGYARSVACRTRSLIGLNKQSRVRSPASRWAWPRAGDLGRPAWT